VLKGVPDIYDYRAICDIVSGVGVEIRRTPEQDVYIDPRHISSGELDLQKTSTFRASYYFVGSLLAKQRKVKIGYPGGDNFVSRPIDQHIKVWKAFGAEVVLKENYYEVSADKLSGADVYFDMITSGATINALLVAALAQGKTTLRNTAKDPEVVDAANFLNQMGAKISGAGTDTIRIQGVDHLGGCTYRAIPDRLIAGAFFMAAGITGGSITVEEIIPEHLETTIMKLQEIGMEFDVQDTKIISYGDVNLRATRVRTGMYPSFATDLQQPLTPLLLKAQGRSIITEKVFPQRFAHVEQLQRMGANIEIKGSSAFIQGGSPLIGTLVHASDVRAGTALILAGLMAEGKTYITGVEHIERGYENLVASFSSLGAKIMMNVDDDLLELQNEQMCLIKNV